MKAIYRILILASVVLFGTACEKDESLEPEFEYTGPVPAIENGGTEGQKICYELYQKYDLHTYYTLSGDEALKTDVGEAQTNPMNTNELPLVAGDERTSTAFLKFMRDFFSFLPEEVVKHSHMKRNVLVKGNPCRDMLKYYIYTINDPAFAKICHTTDVYSLGVAYWGNMSDAIGVQADVWKYNVVYSFFDENTKTSALTNLPPHPGEFSKVAAYYSDLSQEEQREVSSYMTDEQGLVQMDYLYGLGFVDPSGFYLGSKDDANSDLASYAAWIACKSLSERQEIVANYPLVKRKYQLALDYFEKYFQLDLEELSRKMSALTIE